LLFEIKLAQNFKAPKRFKKWKLPVLPSSTQFGEIGTVYHGFAIIIAIGLQKPYAENQNQAQILYLYDVY
jgi:hypothetical protein